MVCAPCSKTPHGAGESRGGATVLAVGAAVGRRWEGGIRLGVLFEVILPIFLVAGAGYLLGRLSRLDATLLTRVVLYLLGPALIFRSLYASTVAGEDVLRIAGFVVILQVALFAVSRGLGRALDWEDDTRAAGSLVMTFANCGTYGLPVLLFAYGEAGFTLGIVYMLTSSLLQATLGVGIGAWHKGTRIRTWLGQAARVPWLYAFLLALLVRAIGWDLPGGVYRGVDLLASAAIPVQLIVLGIQLARVPLRGVAREAVWLTGVKLVAPPLLAWGLAALLGAEGLLRSVLIVEASMPSAINSLILATHFNRRPQLAATVVFLTTVISLGSLTVILSILN
jgi:predicted permease